MSIASAAVRLDATSVPKEPLKLICRVADEPSGDSHDRLRRVFTNSAEGLYRYILVRVGIDRSTADDLLQQMCHVAAQNHALPGDDGECEAWMRGVARNLIRRYWREHKRDRQNVPIEDALVSGQLADDLDSRPMPPDFIAQKENRQQLLLAITELSAEDQRLVYAFYFDGRSQADVADRVGTSVKSVEMKMYRIRNRIRAILKRSKG